MRQLFVGANVDDRLIRNSRGGTSNTNTLVNSKLKRTEDVIVAIVFIALLLPFLAIIALIIRLESPGPALFIQPRRGMNGSVFRLFKFRSMLTQFADCNCDNQSDKDDPRLTGFGSFLRRHSLDEIPQLFNVLFGQMSIVGPRPHALGTNIDGHLLPDISDLYLARYAVKPGMTGLAQVNGCRGSLRTPDQLKARIDHDLNYISDWSIWLDFKIIMLTAVRVVRDNAAH